MILNYFLISSTKSSSFYFSPPLIVLLSEQVLKNVLHASILGETQGNMWSCTILIPLLIVWVIYIQKCLHWRQREMPVRMPVLFAYVSMAVHPMLLSMGILILHFRKSSDLFQFVPFRFYLILMFLCFSSYFLFSHFCLRQNFQFHSL